MKEMFDVSRRQFLQTTALGAAAMLASRSGAPDAKMTPPISAPAPLVAFRYPELGKVAPVNSKQIHASPLGIGFECLDRMMFDPARAYRQLGQLGVKWARCQTGWARTERKPGEYDFTWLDGIANSLLAEGIRPWFSVSYGNRLYSPQAPEWPAVGWAPIQTAEARAAWRRYVKNLVQRFADRVTHWEIWNEVNASGFWQPLKPSPEAYLELLKITVPIIRQAAPKANIIGGAFTGMPVAFLKECLELGMADWVDAISFHPYGRLPELRGNEKWGKGSQYYPKAFAEWKALIARYNPKIAHWQGECGLPSRGGGAGTLGNYPWDETCQAKWLPRRILMDRICGMEVTSLFTAVDLDYGMGKIPNKVNTKGIIHGTDYTPKPAYYVYQCLCALFDAQTQYHPAAVAIRDTSLDAGHAKRIQTARFSRQGKAIFAFWYPHSLPDPFTPGSVTLELPIGADAAMTEPVLIDPMSQKVYRLDGVTAEKAAFTIDRLPLADYPLLITDRSLALG